MKFSELNYSLLNRNVKLKSLKNAKLVETDIIKKNNIYKIYDISRDFFKKDSNKTVRLIDENLNIFWTSHYDIGLV